MMGDNRKTEKTVEAEFPSTTNQGHTADRSFDFKACFNKTIILKICQAVLSLLATITTAAGYWVTGRGYLKAVFISSIVLALFYLLLHTINQLNLCGRRFIFWFEAAKYCVWSILNLIATIIAFVFIAHAGAIIAVAIFATGNTIVMVIDTYFQLHAWWERRNKSQATDMANLPQNEQPPENTDVRVL